MTLSQPGRNVFLEAPRAESGSSAVSWGLRRFPPAHPPLAETGGGGPGPGAGAGGPGPGLSPSADSHLPGLEFCGYTQVTHQARPVQRTTWLSSRKTKDLRKLQPTAPPPTTVMSLEESQLPPPIPHQGHVEQMEALPH